MRIYTLALILVAWFGLSVRGLAQAPGFPLPGPGSADQSNTSVLQNAPVSGILDEFESLSGKHLIRDSSLSGVPNLTINGDGMNKEQFLTFIRYSLQLNGVTMIPVDANTFKVIVAGGASKNPKNEGIPIYTDVRQLPEDDAIVSYYATLNNITPEEAVTIFTAYSPTHTYGSYIPAPSAGAIIITENTNTIKKLLTIKELVDVPPAQVSTEFIQLQRADATKVADTLNKLLDQPTGDSSTSTTPSRPNIPQPQNLPPGFAPIQSAETNFNGGPSEKSLILGKARISADDRSNQVLVITRAANMPFIRRIIAELDSPSDYSAAHRRALNFVLAGDILPALVDGLAQGKDESDEGKGVAANRPTQATQAPQQQNTQALSQSGSSGDSSAPAVSVPSLTQPQQNNVPQVVTVGKTKLLADDRSNAITVFGPPDSVSRVFTMIDQLDRRPLQIYLSTVIGQLTISDSSEFGIDLLQKYLKSNAGGLASSSLESPNASTSLLPEPSSLTSSGVFPIASPGTLGGLTLYGAIGSQLNAYVHALNSTGKFKIIARPSVYTTNNQLALISSGQQVPVPTNTVSGFTGSTNNSLTTSASVGYKDVVLSLEVVPRVSDNHQVTLQIQQQNNTVGSSTIIGGNSVPTINTQLINTVVTVNNKATVVIGGLISENSNTNTSGVPYLEDIPVLGSLFKDKTKSKSRNELIVMIQPSVIDTDKEQYAIDQTEIHRTDVGPDAADSLRLPDESTLPPPAKMR